ARTSSAPHSTTTPAAGAASAAGNGPPRVARAGRARRRARCAPDRLGGGLVALRAPRSRGAAGAARVLVDDPHVAAGDPRGVYGCAPVGARRPARRSGLDGGALPPPHG